MKGWENVLLCSPLEAIDVSFSSFFPTKICSSEAELFTGSVLRIAGDHTLQQRSGLEATMVEEAKSSTGVPHKTETS